MDGIVAGYAKTECGFSEDVIALLEQEQPLCRSEELIKRVERRKMRATPLKEFQAIDKEDLVQRLVVDLGTTHNI